MRISWNDWYYTMIVSQLVMSMSQLTVCLWASCTETPLFRKWDCEREREWCRWYQNSWSRSCVECHGQIKEGQLVHVSTTVLVFEIWNGRVTSSWNCHHLSWFVAQAHLRLYHRRTYVSSILPAAIQCRMKYPVSHASPKTRRIAIHPLQQQVDSLTDMR